MAAPSYWLASAGGRDWPMGAGGPARRGLLGARCPGRVSGYGRAFPRALGSAAAVLGAERPAGFSRAKPSLPLCGLSPKQLFRWAAPGACSPLRHSKRFNSRTVTVPVGSGCGTLGQSHTVTPPRYEVSRLASTPSPSLQSPAPQISLFPLPRQRFMSRELPRRHPAARSFEMQRAGFPPSRAVRLRSVQSAVRRALLTPSPCHAYLSVH